MTGLRVGVSAALGLMVTLGLVFLMFKLIDSGSKELDEGDIIKIPDFLHVERELTENAKKTDVKKPDEPETPPPEIPEDKIDFEVPDNAVSMAAPVVGSGLNASGWARFARDSDFIPVYVPQPQYPSASANSRQGRVCCSGGHHHYDWRCSGSEAAGGTTRRLGIWSSCSQGGNEAKV